MKCNSCGVLCKCKVEKAPARTKAQLKRALDLNIKEKLSVKSFIQSAATKKDAEIGRQIWMALKEVHRQLTRLYRKAS